MSRALPALALALAFAVAGGAALAMTPTQRSAATGFADLCVRSVVEAAPVGAGLAPAESALADRMRALEGGQVWRSTFGGVLIHQSAADRCTVLVPGVEPRPFAWWLERWSNGSVGRHWQGLWFGRLDETAWRSFRRRGGHPVRVIAVTGGDRETSMFTVRQGARGR